MPPTSPATLAPTKNATDTNAELTGSPGLSKPKSPRAATSRGSYRTGIRRRQQIIEAATRHFAQRGYVGASLRDVAADVGVTAGAILRHFGTKEALLGAVVMEWWAQERAQCSPTDVGLAFFLRLPGRMRQHERQPGWIELYLTVAGEASQPDYPLRDIISERFAGVVDDGVHHLQLARERGDIRAMDHDEMVAEVRSLFALMDGLELQWLNGANFGLAETFTRQFAHILQRWGADPSLVDFGTAPVATDATQATP